MLIPMIRSHAWWMHFLSQNLDPIISESNSTRFTTRTTEKFSSTTHSNDWGSAVYLHKGILLMAADGYLVEVTVKLVMALRKVGESGEQSRKLSLYMKVETLISIYLSNI